MTQKYVERTKREAKEAVKMDVVTIHGQTVVIKKYPESGKREKKFVRCKG